MSARFDGVKLMTLRVDFFRNGVNGAPIVEQESAFVNTTTGVTYGRTAAGRLGKDTLDKLRELKELIERDVYTACFEGEIVTGSTATGLSEFITDETGTPSV